MLRKVKYNGIVHGAGRKIYMKSNPVIFKFREINRDIFDAIKNGAKEIETRAAAEKFRAVKPGEVITCICGDSRFEKRVKTIELFPDIDSVLQRYKPQQIHPALRTRQEIIDMYYSFPGYEEEIKKFGILAFVFE